MLEQQKSKSWIAVGPTKDRASGANLWKMIVYAIPEDWNNKSIHANVSQILQMYQANMPVLSMPQHPWTYILKSRNAGIQIVNIKVYGCRIITLFHFFLNTELLLLTWYCKREETARLPLCPVYRKSIANHEFRSTDLGRLIHDDKSRTLLQINI